MTRWTFDDIPNQTGRVALVTGANSGLGYETTLALAQKGAQVIMASRTVNKGETARANILKKVPNAKLEVMPLDLGNLASVRDFADKIKVKFSQLDLLINNAGVMAIPRAETADGFEKQLGTNHLGHFALTGLLLDLLLKTPSSRIVTTSSGAHYFGKINFDDLQSKRGYSRYGAYMQSKLANVLFTFELQRKLDAIGATTLSLSAHPGYASTNLQGTSSHTSGSHLESIGYWLGNKIFAQSAAMGALPQLYAATAPDVKGAEFFGPSFMYARGYPKRERAAKAAFDKTVAAKLWEVSETLTGVHFDALKQPQAVTA